MDSDRTLSLEELIEERVPGVRRRTMIAAFDRARPRCFSPDVSGLTRIDTESITRLRKVFASFPGQLRLPDIRRTLGIRKGASDEDFEKAMRAWLLRIVEETVALIPIIQRARREHPVLDLSGLPVTPDYEDDYPIAVAGYVAVHRAAQGVLHLASYNPETGMAMSWEVWRHPSGGRGGEWREEHIEDFGEGWVRDPSGGSDE